MIKKPANTLEEKCTKNLKIFGDFWTLWVIDVLSKEDLRYCGIQRALQNINPVTLTNRLQKLEKANIIKRTEDKIDKVSVTYSLTPLGKKTLPIIQAINNFRAKK
ncbi:MAG: Transcriptional regulator [Candidatus Taylorbacteria bacterium]|nr:Transcriptional regulator [Candidatus Taylorbacteria bacterium]